MAPIIPGTIFVATDNTLLKILKSLIIDRSVYQLFAIYRARGVQPSWRMLPFPAALENGGLLSCPVLPGRRQPFVLDLKPDGSAPEATVQITAKMALWSASSSRYVVVLRKFTRKLRLSDNIEEIISSVNPSVLLWLWVTRTLDQSIRNVLAGVFRAATGLIGKLAANDVKRAALIHGCCALKFLDFASDEAPVRSGGRYALCLNPPALFPVVPVYDPEKGFAVAGSVVFADEESNDGALKAYFATFVGGSLRRPIPDWCKAADPKSAEFLNSLLAR
jgi:hypothetical protein